MRLARTVALVFVVAIAIGFSMDASAAQFKYRPISNTATGGINPPDADYYPDDSGTVGGNFFYCNAQVSKGQRCYTWLTYYTSSGAERTGCAAVSTNASCQCNTTTGALKGQCKVWP